MSTTFFRRLSRRRRPKARRAVCRNVFEEEEEELPITYPDLHPRRKKEGVMQKLSNWLGDHLRKSKRDPEPKRPQVLGPTECGSLPRPSDIRVYGNQRPLLGSAREVKRRAICTNPWFVPEEEMNSSFMSDALDSSYCSTLSRMTKDEALRINTMAGSACSSGYASQDSSPECSVHQPSWQPSTQIMRRGNLVDKAVECGYQDIKTPLVREDDYDHIYHELDTQKRQPFMSFLDFHPDLQAIDSCYSGSDELACSSMASSRPESPIYAIPYSSAAESHCGSIEYADDSDGYMELMQRHEDTMGPSYRQLKRYPGSAFSPVRPEPRFHAPPPPPAEPTTCLEMLDKQIADLKEKTLLVSRLVESAKERRELRGCARLLCMEHIQHLRNMRWYVENGFELKL
ncbi:unnamed protein product [Bursaphelenchus xylophilus]|uniref:(pine wood nematode) hypothetical protein n=1 Tax=Bursaphelenchus xylophilus TaxID=6326 RepID=A0A1I7SLX7_BURXY|nr:unnamed protein product [Bursaphelenchus xylophilus]CAG9129911.1 unnamed protein product [Bursaphelenchus xylophilus]